MDIQKMYEDSQKTDDLKIVESLEKKLRFYINGGIDGLRYIYYNFQEEQNIKFSEITPFEEFIDENSIEKFFLNEVFFEVDNKYFTNIGAYIYTLCSYYINSEKPTENKKSDLISIVNRLDEEINKSSIYMYNDCPKLYGVLKKIENFYVITYDNLYDDFAPFLIDRPKRVEIEGNEDLPSAPIEPFNREELKTFFMLDYIDDFVEAEATYQRERVFIKDNKWVKEKKELIKYCKVIFNRGYIKPRTKLKAVFNFFERRYNITLGDQSKPSKHENIVYNEFDFTIIKNKK